MCKSQTLICALISLLILGGLGVLIAWLADKMKSPAISINQGAINNYNLSPDNYFNASFTFIVRSHNSDPKYKIKYRVVAVSVYHNKGYALGFKTLGPNTQAHGQELMFTAQPVAGDVLVSDADVAGAIRSEIKAGELRVEVRVRASVRYEVKGWKHRRYVLRAFCFPVVISLTSGKTIRKTDCDVHLYRGDVLV